ncbi:putative Sterol 24-c-methyltransferase [Taphrina deformans PYCC 5710]|uniref:Sterol 24-C-methyltransferase n=1 Tax=Taphrina deformans (strain PYCC 5710 / ATCC 11124 / CBS 356.35 / IMI 108563 / JCM 9778 / NBRC 8474) TaxID=1097556 RepID=R4X8P4_TAPDE|nr:putative Sterol 24-c-methyltransferase [Taphrina deformans PYCC 5710]|eukprot:CCG81755.1 putative Sterol 24-c-methyltransferase [Taphrina deformans PYCC 5710]
MAPDASSRQMIHTRDKQHSEAMHGKKGAETVGFGAMLQKNKDAAEIEAQKYFKFFERETGDTTTKEMEERLGDYTSLTNAYYNLATDLYEYGWGQSFHFARYYKGEPFYQAIARHEHFLAHKMNLKAGDNVLDVGCGVGGPAREIATFSGANVLGLNNNDYQISRAEAYSARRGLSKQCKYIKGDFMNMPFEDATFDAVYAIEATVHAPKLEGVYGEIFRVLKPGGTFGVYEWLMTDRYDESNREHREIRHGIEVGDGIPQMVKIDECLRALKAVGFEIEYNNDLAEEDGYVPWYYPLEGKLSNIQSPWDLLTCFRMTKYGRFITQTAIGLMERVRLAPKGTQQVGAALETAADALVAGGQQKLFTPMYLAVCKKPNNK